MNEFEFIIPRKIVFGEGKIHSLSEHILNFGNNVLFLCGGSSLKASGMYDKIIQKFEKNNISYEVYNIKEEPTVEIVDKLAKEYRNKRVDVIVSVGGGSVIDLVDEQAAKIGAGHGVSPLRRAAI